MKYGFDQRQFNLILACFKKIPEIEQVILFGSRAMGNFKPASDVDLYVIGSAVTAQTLSRLHGLLNEESPLPFQFDIIAPPLSTEIQAHIDKFGVTIYNKSETK